MKSVHRLSSTIEKVRVWGWHGVMSFFLGKMNDARQARRMRANARHSRTVTPVRGITVIADVSGQAALQKTTRDFIKSLRDAGVPCQVMNIASQDRIPKQDLEGLVTPASQFDIRRYTHVVEMYRAPLDRRIVPGIRICRIAFHETAYGIDDTAPYLKASGDTVIAMSDFNYAYFRRNFEHQPVVKILYPLRLDMYGATARDVLRARYGVAQDDFLVYFNFDFGSYHRKNPLAAVHAFDRAFRGVPSARLLFKTKGAKLHRDQCDEVESLVVRLGLKSRFVHITDFLPKADVDGLAGACDAYISLHRGEGLGLGMAEAMAQGKPVVATDWSASTEFCMPDTACCIPYRIVPIRPHEYMRSMREWAEADVDAAAAALKRLYDDPAYRVRLGAAAKRFINEHFSLANFKASVEAFLGD